MKTYEFTITIAAMANNADEAYFDAVTALSLDPGATPEDYTVMDEDEEQDLPDCNNCLHQEKTYDQEPCNECTEYQKWEVKP